MKIFDSLSKYREWFSKNKKVALALLCGFILIFVIFLSEVSFSTGKSEKETDAAGIDDSEYCRELESRIEEIVSSIKKKKKTKVMITLSETTEYIYAQNTNGSSKNTADFNDTSNQNEFVIIDCNNSDGGLLIKTIEPKIKGVAVVCEGGGNTKVQEQIYSAVGAVLNISSSRISVSKLTTSEVEE